MAKSEKTPAKNNKKALQQEIAGKLQETFPALKESVGAKKFDRHVKKASKVLAAGATKKSKEAKPAKKTKPAKTKAAS